MMMDTLNQYQQIKREIKTLEQKIKIYDREQMAVIFDSVKGSSPEFPYVKHVIPIAGYSSDKKLISKKERLECTHRNRLAKLIALEIEIEEFIDSVKDSQIRQIIAYRFLDGHSWRKVSRLIGHPKQDPQYPAKTLLRYFEKSTVCTK